jgi:glycosyltransferase involved in cell wall biosynthesis
MAVAAISMVKDEADVIEGTIRHIANEVDLVLVADNGSTDGTRQILEQLSSELGVIVVDDPDPAYYQSAKMSRLAEQAATIGAEWIVPFDADELWLANDRLCVVLPALAEDVNVAHASLFNHFASAIDPAGDDPFRTIVWRQRHPGALPKVAFRWEPGAVVHQGNHGVTLPDGETFNRCLEVRHFPYRSASQFIRKARNGAAAYAASDLPADWGAHWRSYGEILDRHGEEALADVYRTHFWHLSPIDAGMVHDPAAYRRWEE